MSSNKLRIRQCIDRGISDKPMLLHGTSPQAIEIMAATGRLPLGECKAFYFTPISHRFERSEYSVPLRNWRYTKRSAISQARFYARICALERSLEEQFGYLPHWFGGIPHSQKQVYYWFVEEEQTTMYRKLLMEKIRKAFQYRGVIIEPSERIFSLIYGPGDDSNTVAFSALRGLPIDYIQGMQPISEKDQQRLDQLIH